MFLAVVNKSTVISNDDVRNIITACNAQIRLHVAPLWNRIPAPVVFYADPAAIPDYFDQLVLLDNSDQAGVLGYHKETPKGLPYSRAFIKTALDAGGSLLHGDLSASAAVSHEVCEWFINPDLNLWAEGPNGLTPLEVTDPVQDMSYKTGKISVSNFVVPSYFDQHAPVDSQLDYLGTLKKPFSISPGGYILVLAKGALTQQQGKLYANWLKKTKAFPAARTARIRAHFTTKHSMAGRAGTKIGRRKSKARSTAREPSSHS
jgi:hypothetical protein